MKSSIGIAILLTFVLMPSFSNQNDNIFKKWKKINFFKKDNNDLKNMEELAIKYIDEGELESALKTANRGLELSAKVNSPEHISNFYNFLGEIYFFKNQWDSAVFYYNKCIKEAQQLRNKKYIALAYRNLSQVYIDMGNLKDALRYCKIALKINEETGNRKGIAYTYNCMGGIYSYMGDPKTAFDYYFNSNSIISELNDDPLLYKNFISIAVIHSNLGSYDSSFFYLNKVIEADEQKIQKSDIAFAYSLLGDLYSFYGNHSKAMEYQMKALEINEKIKNKKGIAMGYSSIGNLFELREKYKDAIKYYIKCLGVAQEIGGYYGIILSYDHLGNDYYNLKNYETAKKYFLEGLTLARKLNMQPEIGAAYKNLGLIYMAQKDYPSALSSFQESLNIYEKCNFKSGLAAVNFNIGKYYQQRAEYKNAVSYFHNALKLYQELKNLGGMANSLSALSENYSLLSLYKEANVYLKRSVLMNDSLKAEDHTKRITQLEMQHEFDKKQKEKDFIQQQKEQALQSKIRNQKIVTFSSLSVIISLLIISFFVFRNYRLKQKNIRKDTELKQLETQKKHEIDQMKLHFFANASHDIRTPLTLISGPVNELMETKEFTSRTAENIEFIYRNTNLLCRFVDQILDFQKLDSNVMSLELEHLDIIRFTKKITETFALYIENKQCQLKFVPENDELIIWFDPGKLEKILYNLIFNAIKFTPDRGTININISADAEKVSISVKDNGVGIPSDRLSLIFERYYQVDNTKTFYKGGTGIGLAHTKELVTLHKGEITVKSKEQEGSEFTVILPRNKSSYNSEEVIFQTRENIASGNYYNPHITTTTKNDDKAGISPDLAFQDTPEGTEKSSVLIVEDDQDMHRFIVNCLQSEFHIYRAYNGKEGFNLAIKHNPDVIVSDVMMENMNGIELCSKIKTELQVCHIPVILLTALASLKSKITGFETGADDYITKPFDAKLLRARIKNITQSRCKLRDIFSKNIILEPQKITINSLDEGFLKKAIRIIEENISDSDFDVDFLCSEMGVSRSVFFRKIKNLTNLTSSDFVKSIRLKRSAQLLRESDLSVSQIAYEVSFSDRKYFSKCFKEYFGKSPSEYAKQ